MIELYTPLQKEQFTGLRKGDKVFLTGFIYTARDQAHKRLVAAIKCKQHLPIDLPGQVIYYCGPTPAARGKIIGSCGPTTSSRMDEFSPVLLKAGLTGMIGKGSRSEPVVRAIKEYKAIYFLTYAGCGALLAGYVKDSELVAYPELGPEAIYRLRVEKFPLIVGIDTQGNSIF